MINLNTYAYLIQYFSLPNISAISIRFFFLPIFNLSSRFPTQYKHTNTFFPHAVLWTEFCTIKVHMFKPSASPATPQCDGIWREGLWEIIRFRWGPNSGPSWGDQCPCLKNLQRACSSCFSLPQEDPMEKALGRTWPCCPLLSDFSPPKLGEHTFLLFKLPNLWCFVMEVWAD